MREQQALMSRLLGTVTGGGSMLKINRDSMGIVFRKES